MRQHFWIHLCICSCKATWFLVPRHLGTRYIQQHVCQIPPCSAVMHGLQEWNNNPTDSNSLMTHDYLSFVKFVLLCSTILQHATPSRPVRKLAMLSVSTAGTHGRHHLSNCCHQEREVICSRGCQGEGAADMGRRLQRGAPLTGRSQEAQRRGGGPPLSCFCSHLVKEC